MSVFKSRVVRTRVSNTFAGVKLGLVMIGAVSVLAVFMPGRAQAADPPCLSQAAVAMHPVLEPVEDAYVVELKRVKGAYVAKLETVKDAYVVEKGRVRHRDGKDGKLVLYGAVFSTTGSRVVPWTHFSVLFTDPDGLVVDGKDAAAATKTKKGAAGDKSRVEAVLWFMDQSGSPPQQVVKLDSNKARAENPGHAKMTRNMRVEIKKHKLNFERNYYFVEITLTRDEAPNNPYYPDVIGFKLCKQFK